MSIPDDYVLKDIIATVTGQIDLALTHSLDVSVNDIALRTLESHFRQHPSKIYNETKALLESFKEKKITHLTQHELTQLTKLIKMLSLTLTGPIHKQLDALLSGATARSINDHLKEMKPYLPSYSDEQIHEIEGAITMDFEEKIGGAKFDDFTITTARSRQFELDNIEDKRFPFLTITLDGETFHFDSDKEIKRFRDKAHEISLNISRDPQVQKKIYDSILLLGTQTYFNSQQRDRLALSTPVFTGITEADSTAECKLVNGSAAVRIEIDRENLALDVQTEKTTLVRQKALFKEGQEEKGEALLQLAGLNYLAGITTKSRCRVSIDPNGIRAIASLTQNPSISIFRNPQI